jgi:hypothetical protein
MSCERQAPLGEGLAVAGSGRYGSNLTVPIEVLKVTPIPNGGNLKAYATVRVGHWTIHGTRVVQQPGQRAWVSLPQAEGKPDSSGKRTWWAVIECADKALKQAIETAVLKAWGGVEHGRD